MSICKNLHLLLNMLNHYSYGDYNIYNDINTHKKEISDNCSLQSLLYIAKFIQPNNGSTSPSNSLSSSLLSIHISDASLVTWTQILVTVDYG